VVEVVLNVSAVGIFKSVGSARKPTSGFVEAGLEYVSSYSLPSGSPLAQFRYQECLLGTVAVTKPTTTIVAWMLQFELPSYNGGLIGAGLASRSYHIGISKLRFPRLYKPKGKDKQTVPSEDGTVLYLRRNEGRISTGLSPHKYQMRGVLLEGCGCCCLCRPKSSIVPDITTSTLFILDRHVDDKM
jgi:hypothetical protein